MRYSTQQVIKISEEFVSFFEGSESLNALLIQAEKAGVDLKYLKRVGLDRTIIVNIFKATNAQGKMDDLLDVIANEGFNIREAFFPEVNTAKEPFERTKLEITNYSSYIYTGISSQNRRSSLIEGFIISHENRPMRLFIKVSLIGCSDTILVPVEVNSFRESLPFIRYPKFSIEESEKLKRSVESFSLTVELLEVGNTAPIDVWQSEIWVTKPDIILLARTNSLGIYEDYTSDLAWFVTPNLNDISDFIVKHIPANMIREIGYSRINNGENYSQNKKSVEKQVRKIYEGLVQLGITYLPAEVIQTVDKNVILQRSRSAEQILKDPVHKANCLDISILMASLLEQIGIEPVLLIVPQHAIVGWKYYPLDLSTIKKEQLWKYCGFIDAVLSSAGMSFEVALSSGDGYLLKWLNKIDTSNGSINEFARIVDVKFARNINLFHNS